MHSIHLFLAHGGGHGLGGGAAGWGFIAVIIIAIAAVAVFGDHPERSSKSKTD